MGTQIPSIRGFGGSFSHMALNIGRQLRKLPCEGFQEGHEDAYMSHIKVQSMTTYHILLDKFGELSIELHALKLTMGFQQ